MKFIAGVTVGLMFVGPLAAPVDNPEEFNTRTYRFVAEFVAQYQKLNVFVEVGAGAGESN
jgi:hypothetical protein